MTAYRRFHLQQVCLGVMVLMCHVEIIKTELRTAKPKTKLFTTSSTGKSVVNKVPHCGATEAAITEITCTAIRCHCQADACPTIPTEMIRANKIRVLVAIRVSALKMFMPSRYP